MYRKAVEQYRLGAAKLDEASKQKIDAMIAEYFGAWSQVRAKSAERRAISREYVLLWLDKEVDTREKLDAKTKEIEKRIDVLDAAIDELVAKANKIKSDNPDMLN